MKTPSKVIQHDYLSVNCGNGRVFTTSRSGEKVPFVAPPGAQQTWLLLFGKRGPTDQALAGTPALSSAQREFLKGMQGEIRNGAKVDAFAAHIDKIWPEWAAAPVAFVLNQEITFDFGRRGGTDSGKVVKVGRSVTVKFERMGLVQMSADLLATGGKS